MDPDSLQAIDDVVKLAGLVGALAALFVTVRKGGRWVKKWWHRKRDRQEQILRNLEDRQEQLLKDAVLEIRGELGAHSATVAKQLLEIGDDVAEVKGDVKDIRKAQSGHLNDHATGKFRTA